MKTKTSQQKGFFRMVVLDGMIMWGGSVFLVILAGDVVAYLFTKRWWWDSESLIVVGAFCLLGGLAVGFFSGLVRVFQFGGPK